MGRLSKEAVLAAEDLPKKVIFVEEWGGEVELRGLTGLERDAFEAECLDNSGDEPKVKLENIRSKLLARCICDENGKPMFSPEELGSKSGAVLSRLFEVAQKLSGLSEKDVKGLAENLPAAQSGASTSV